MISITKLNDKKVVPVNLPKYDISKIKGNELVDELYANIFLLAKKKSGKSNVVFFMLKKFCNKNTTVIIFASTVHKDDVWKEIVKWLKKKGINVLIFTSINENGENQISKILNTLNDVDEQEEEEPKEKKFMYLTDPVYKPEEEEGKNYKPKLIAPELIFVFDDISSDLQDKNVSVLLKANRHYKSKVIISSQYFNDVPKDARNQLDYVLLYPHIPLDKLEKVYQELDLSIPYEAFIACYNDATSTKYNFLYVDVRSEKLRKNFSHQYNIKS